MQNLMKERKARGGGWTLQRRQEALEEDLHQAQEDQAQEDKARDASVLQVDDSGKVQRLRKECPNSECGAETFMANHFDCHYCCKCDLTYVCQKVGGD
ncbi:ubiquitin-40s ribosomal protein s27a [Quercus suber]|uniref:Ubiquitin-40s ribosomal protein s27a n=1 Tax=Quercus suber TaxID=58331 RepID=A0AAW0LTJ6_QUESU